MGKKPAARRLAENEAQAMAWSIRSGAQRLNLVAEMIRGLDASIALHALTFSPRRVAGEVRKVLQSAIANAENNHQLDVDRLYVAEATVGRSLVIKRWRPRARGRAGHIEKPFSNLRIVVRERQRESRKERG